MCRLSAQNEKVPSIEQKRMLAFINHFILNTVDFLNKFIANCETKFIEFDTKLQKVESSLLIVESKVRNANTFSQRPLNLCRIFQFLRFQLASMPDGNDSPTTPKPEIASSVPSLSPPEPVSQPIDINANSVPSPEVTATNIESKDETDEIETAVKGIKITEDVRYKKYFKMMQMGVPAAAVKIKMQIEGFDGDLLE